MVRWPIIPDVRGTGRLVFLCSRIEQRLGIEPSAIVRMREGHLLRLDRRSAPERHAFYTGCGREDAVSVLQRFIEPGRIILDVGANVGVVTVPLAVMARQRGASVMAFEPLAKNVETLRFNIEANFLTNVEVCGFGLSSRDGAATVALRGGAVTGNAAIEIQDGQDEAFQRFPIHLRRLDDVLGEQRSSSIGPIKLDIEGHEDEFMLGAERTLAESRPAILMEVNKVYYQRKNVDMDEAILGRLPRGYRLMRLAFSRPTQMSVFRVSGFVEVENFNACRTVEDVLLLPQEKASHISG